jgi:hypothetical protein
MPTFAQGIPSFDPRIAANTSWSDSHDGTRLSVCVGHRFERGGRRSERAVHPSPFVGMQSEELKRAETEAGMRFELRAFSSLLVSHADVSVAMPDAIGAMRCERTTDAPRRPSALPRARRASLGGASATVRTGKEALPRPRDASPVPRHVPPTPRHAVPIPPDASPVPCDAPPVRRALPPRASDEARVRRTSPPGANDALRVPRASPPAASDAPRVLRASRLAASDAAQVPRAPSATSTSFAA